MGKGVSLLGNGTRCDKRDASKEKKKNFEEDLAALLEDDNQPDAKTFMDKEELKFMSDANRIKRYSTYLHHSFYIGQDVYI